MEVYKQGSLLKRIATADQMFLGGSGYKTRYNCFITKSLEAPWISQCLCVRSISRTFRDVRVQQKNKNTSAFCQHCSNPSARVSGEYSTSGPPPPLCSLTWHWTIDSNSELERESRVEIHTVGDNAQKHKMSQIRFVDINELTRHAPTLSS